MTEEVSELRRRLERAEAMLEALQSDEVDAAVRKHGVTALRLRETEEKLRESEARYRRLFEGMPEGFALGEIITDEDSRPRDYCILEVNPAFERLAGLKAADVLGRRILEVLPDTESHWIEKYGEVALGGQPARFENFSAALGRWYEVFAHRFAPGRFAAVFTDITDRKQAEEALRQSEERLRQAMDAGRVFTFEWDPNTDEVRRSENCGPILGLDPTNCIRTTRGEHLERIDPEDRQAFVRLAQSLTTKAPEYDAQYRYVREDGRTVWLEENGRAQFDDNGRLTRVRGVTADVTERVEAQIRESDAVAAFAAARSAVDTVNAMGEGVILFRLDGSITAVNPATEKLIGLKRERLAGRNLRTLLPRLLKEEDLDMAKAALDEVAEGRMPELGHMVFRAGASTPVSISPSLAFVQSPDGEPVTAVLTLKDVTELHQTNELLNRLFDHTQMQIVYLDKEFNFLRVNRAYAEASGHEPEHLLGKNYFDIRRDPESGVIFERVRDTGETFAVYEKSLERLDGELTYWDWSLGPVEDDGGDSEGLLLCLLDVTDRVRVRQQFVETERKYRDLVQSVNSIIMRVTPERRITFLNDCGQRFFGYSEDEVAGKDVVGTILPEFASGGRDLETMTGDIAAHPEHHGPTEIENVCKDGRRVWVQWSNRAVRNEQGRTTEILCVGTDVTERKRLEEETEAYRLRLRALADRLVATEEQERRRVSTHLHDTVIQTLSLANIRLGGVLKALQAEGLSDQGENVDQARKLIGEGISECRTLMADLTPPLLYELGLVPALKDLAEKQRDLHGVAITVEEDGLPKPLTESERGLLFQSARELVTNAMKYAGPCEIHIRFSREDADLHLDVTDTGKGFDLRAAGLFDVHEEGGFGLFNIRERLRALGGGLAIASAPGEGTAATVRIPISEEQHV